MKPNILTKYILDYVDNLLKLNKIGILQSDFSCKIHDLVLLHKTSYYYNNLSIESKFNFDNLFSIYINDEYNNINNYKLKFQYDLNFDIPDKFEKIYELLTSKLSNLGLKIIHDCSVACCNNTNIMLLCWNLFYISIVAYYQEQLELSDNIANYISELLTIKINI